MASGFTTEQVSDAIRFVALNGAAVPGQNVYYEDVYTAAGLSEAEQDTPELVSRFLKELHRRCRELGLPDLDALIVYSSGDRQGRPGSGYFRLNGLVDPFDDWGEAVEAADAIEFLEDRVREAHAWGARLNDGVEFLPD